MEDGGLKNMACWRFALIGRGRITFALVLAVVILVFFIEGAHIIEGTAAGPEIIVSNESLKPGETILVTVKNLEPVTNDSVVFCELRDAENKPIGSHVSMEHKEGVWKCYIKAPEQPGNYTIWVIVDDNEADIYHKQLTVVEVVQPTKTPEATATPEIIVTNASFMPGEIKIVPVKNLTQDADIKVLWEDRDAENKIITNGLMVSEGDVRKCYIKAPEQPGNYTIRVLAADGTEIVYKNLTVEESEPHRGWLWYAVIIAAAALIAIIAILLLFLYFSYLNEEPKMGNLSVQVRNEQGKGVPGAKVIVEWKKNKMPKHARTSDMGWVDFTLPEGTWCNIKADKEGVGSGKREIKVSRRGSTAKVILKPDGDIKRGAGRAPVYTTAVEEKEQFLNVQITDEKGEKAEGVKVKILQNNKLLSHGVTDENGGCKLFKPKVKGQVYITAEKEGYEQAKKKINMEQRRIKLSFQLKPLEVEQKMGRLTLTVLNEANEPLDDAMVMIDGKTCYMQSKGEMTVQVPYGERKISVTKEGYVPYEETVKVEEDTQRKITLTRKQGTLEIKAVGKVSKEPLEGITVCVLGECKKTNKEGTIRFEKVYLGVPTITCRDHNGFYAPTTESCEVVEGDNHLEITMHEYPAISEEQENSLTKIERSMQDIVKNIPPEFDSSLPRFYLSLCTTLNTFVRSVPEKSKGILGILFELVMNTCESITVKVSEERFQQLYKGTSESLEFQSLESHYESSFLSLIRDTEGFYEQNFARTLARIKSVDTRITEKMSEFVIFPATTIWRLAKKMVEEEKAKNEPKRCAVSAFVAGIMLDYVDLMLEGELGERLKKS